MKTMYIKAGTSEYVQGVEVAMDYAGEVPDGFDIIELPKCKYIMFQGEPFEEEDFVEAIQQVWDAIKKYNPESIGYAWDNSNPRIQLEPIGTRGYIELHPVKSIRQIPICLIVPQERYRAGQGSNETHCTMHALPAGASPPNSNLTNSFDRKHVHRKS